LSIVHEIAMAPDREMRPDVGLKPVAAQNALGHNMLPHVSVPTEKPTSPADVAAAEPPDDPPDQYSVFHGVLQAPLIDDVAYRYPTLPANSIMASLPSNGQPASRNLVTTTASSSIILSP
jgi:hypothetical protein